MRAARQLSLIGAASGGSKLGDQLQTPGGIAPSPFAPSVVAASVASELAGTLPPHAASSAAKTTTRRTMSTLPGLRDARVVLLGPTGQRSSRLDVQACARHKDIRARRAWALPARCSSGGESMNLIESYGLSLL